MKYLITGITGFAGPHLANTLLREGHEVFGLVRNSNGRETDILDIVEVSNFTKINFLYGDLRNTRIIANIFKNNIFDGVFHLAAQSHPPTSFIDPVGTWEDNVMGSMNLIQGIQDHQPDCKLMFCSTSEVYGNVGEDGHIIKTTDTLLPANPYGASKAAIDLYLQERFENKKINGFITRAFSHTGPRRGKTFSISSDAFQLAAMMRDNKLPKDLKVGNLESVRVVLDVRDIVEAYYKLMKTDKSNGKIYNVCGDTPRKMSVYTDLLIDASDLIGVKKKVYEPYYRPIDIHYQHGDCFSLKYDTDWEQKISIEDTMSDLIDYWYNKL